MALPPGRARLATKPCPTGSETATNTIGYGAHLQGERRQCRCGGGDDQVRLKFNQLLRQRPGSGWIAAIPAIVDAQIATLGPSELPERLLERRPALAILRIVLGERHEHADAPHPLASAARAPRAATPLPRHRAA